MTRSMRIVMGERVGEEGAGQLCSACSGILELLPPMHGRCGRD